VGRSEESEDRSDEELEAELQKILDCIEEESN
jgi:hypothetical protein